MGPPHLEHPRGERTAHVDALGKPPKRCRGISDPTPQPFWHESARVYITPLYSKFPLVRAVESTRSPRWRSSLASPVTADRHPYSTYDFVNRTTHWSRVNRTTLRPGDALTYNTNGAGHMVLFESGADPWGNLWLFEARGCSTGIVHNLRTVGTNYIAIRREGL